MEDFLYISTGYNAVIHYINPNPNKSFTMLPLECRVEGVTGPFIRICYFHDEDDAHFIHLDLDDICPVPPMAYIWFKMRQLSVFGWEHPWASAMHQWENAINQYPQYQLPPKQPWSGPPLELPETPPSDLTWDLRDYISFD